MKGMIKMKFDITWTITIVMAFSSVFSSIAIAIINNRHNEKLQKMKLEHDFKLQELQIEQQENFNLSSIYYSDKKSAFSDFLKAAGHFPEDKQSLKNYGSLHASIDNASLFCNSKNRSLLEEFLNFVNTEAFSSGYDTADLTTYSNQVTLLALSLSKELEISKPVINCDNCDNCVH